jgi:hypothetical protein
MSRTRISVFSIMLFALLAFSLAGCTSQQTANSRTDSQVAADIQNKINSDPALPNKQISVGASGGVVTLSGTVASESERVSAGNDASQVEGVKTVLNNLVVSGAASGMADANPTPASRRPTPSRASSNRVQSSSAPQSRANGTPADSNTQSMTAPPIVQSAPAAPVIADVTVPSGAVFSIRTIEPIDTSRAQVGDSFSATLDAPIEVDGKVVIPEHADVQGRVADVRSAGKFEGSSLLALQLTKVSFGGRSYRIVTDQWSKTGASRGKNTAAKVGGGAAAGAIIGAIAGGGKGAAIGAGVGAGVGGGAQAMTHGQQIVLNPETVLTFTLRSPVTVTPASGNRNRNRITDNSNQ